MDDKEAKKRALLAEYLKLVEHNLNSGMKAMRYWCVKDADDCEARLQSYHKIFTEMTADKKTIVKTISDLDDTVYYMSYLWVENFCGRNGFKVDPKFAEDIDSNHMAYLAKVQKSVDAKQSHAPGFDGQGGGR